MMAARAIPNALPSSRGRLTYNAPLGSQTWFQAGGNAEVLFKPADTDDLCQFLAALDVAMPVTVLGVGSNTLIRDGGVRGVVIRLGRGFTHVEVGEDSLVVGAGALDSTIADVAAEAGRTGLEFLSGIPGTLGGNLRMNAGAYGREMKDCVRSVVAVDRHGEKHHLTVVDMAFGYRSCGIPDDWIFVEAVLDAPKGDSHAIYAEMQRIRSERDATQPVKGRTGGSTFANPDGQKAWQLIDAAGCRGLTHGRAQVSEKHCNFLLNLGGASAAEIEGLGEMVRDKVRAHAGVDLRWEIKRIGERG